MAFLLYKESEFQLNFRLLSLIKPDLYCQLYRPCVAGAPRASEMANFARGRTDWADHSFTHNLSSVAKLKLNDILLYRALQALLYDANFGPLTLPEPYKVLLWL